MDYLKKQNKVGNFSLKNCMCFLCRYILNQKKKKNYLYKSTLLPAGIFFVSLPINHLLGGVDAKQGKVVFSNCPWG